MDFTTLIAQIGGALGAQATGGSQGLQQFMSNMTRMASQQIAMDFEREQRAAQSAMQARDRALQQAQADRIRQADRQHDLLKQQRQFDHDNRKQGLLDSTQVKAASNQMLLRAQNDSNYARTLMSSVRRMGAAVPAEADSAWLATLEGRAALNAFAQDLGRGSAEFVGALHKDELSKRENVSQLVGTDMAFKMKAEDLDSTLQAKRGQFVGVTGKINGVSAGLDTLTSEIAAIEGVLPDLSFPEARAKLVSAGAQYQRQVAELEELREKNPEMFFPGSALNTEYQSVLSKSRKIDVAISSINRRVGDIHAARTDLSDPQSFPGFQVGTGGGEGDLEKAMFRSGIKALASSEQGQRWDKTASLIRGLTDEDALKLNVLDVKKALTALDNKRAAGYAEMTAYDRGATEYEKSLPATLSSILASMRSQISLTGDQYATDPGALQGASGIAPAVMANNEFAQMSRIVQDIHAAGTGALESRLLQLRDTRTQTAALDSRLAPAREALGPAFALSEEKLTELVDAYGSRGDPTKGMGKMMDDAAMQRLISSEYFVDEIVAASVSRQYEGVDLADSAVADAEYAMDALGVNVDTRLRVRRKLRELGYNEVESELVSVPIPALASAAVVQAERASAVFSTPGVRSNVDAINMGGRSVAVVPSMDIWEDTYGNAALGGMGTENTMSYLKETKDRDSSLFTAAVSDGTGAYTRAPLFSDFGVGRTNIGNFNSYDVVNLFASAIPTFREYAQQRTDRPRYIGAEGRPAPAVLPREDGFLGEMGALQRAISAKLYIPEGGDMAMRPRDEAILIGAQLLDAAREYDLSDASGLSEVQRDALKNVQTMLRGMESEELAEFMLSDEGIPLEQVERYVATSRGYSRGQAPARLSQAVVDQIPKQRKAIKEALAEIEQTPTGSRFDIHPETAAVDYARLTEPMKTMMTVRYKELDQRLQLREQYAAPAYDIATDTRNTYANMVLSVVRDESGEGRSLAEEIRNSREMFVGGRAQAFGLPEQASIDSLVNPLERSMTSGATDVFDTFSDLMSSTSFMLRGQQRGLTLQGAAADKIVMDQLVGNDLNDARYELAAVKKAYDRVGGYNPGFDPMLRQLNISPENFKQRTPQEQVMTLWAIQQIMPSMSVGFGR